MHRILLVEDSPDLAEGLQRNLEMDGYEVSLAMKGAHALALATSDHPDLIVLDLGLPDRDGYTVLQDLRERGSTCPVLILSARSLEADKLQGFRLGADDYVTKPFSVMELLARISALLRRANKPAPVAAVAGDAPRAAALDDDALRETFGLTARQISVTRLLGEGYSNAEIAKQLSVSYFTARNHVEQVLGKLGVSTRAAVGAVLYGQG
ncbi:response regulator [Longimicrobium terrae]|uniref:DNA-binding response OmpR family regulator n=1 Tax=Longimicrobium terrae TaxID=1639882 RepID=A0A841H7J1_9BACT|nr:response regulator [Longimicrobium terrae]MBB4639707.1 DNA-binding response OmpR family regulator [Longimicrobium terrae]MBB6074100.1 DNA-binding response OmpR family regulator [Longimicrobium terrae]NNC32201.1 response regulator [Longimicrobium terrae]